MAAPSSVWRHGSVAAHEDRQKGLGTGLCTGAFGEAASAAMPADHQQGHGYMCWSPSSQEGCCLARSLHSFCVGCALQRDVATRSCCPHNQAMGSERAGGKVLRLA